MTGLAISFDSHLQVTMVNYPTQKEVDQLSTSFFISSITIIQIELEYQQFLNNYDYLVKKLVCHKKSIIIKVGENVSVLLKTLKVYYRGLGLGTWL